jgi:hypothetical protein
MISLRVAGRGWLRNAAGSVASGRLTGGMQCTEKGHKRGGFCGTEILAVRGHIAAALNYLVRSERHGNAIEGGTALSTQAIDRSQCAARV